MSFRRNNFLLTNFYFHSVQTLKKGSRIFFSDHQTKNLSSLALQVFHTQQVSVTQPLTFQRSAVWWWCKPTFVWRNPWTSAAAWPARCPALRCRRRSLRWCPDGPAGRDGTEDTGGLLTHVILDFLVNVICSFYSRQTRWWGWSGCCCPTAAPSRRPPAPSRQSICRSGSGWRLTPCPPGTVRWSSSAEERRPGCKTPAGGRTGEFGKIPGTLTLQLWQFFLFLHLLSAVFNLIWKIAKCLIIFLF